MLTAIKLLLEDYIKRCETHDFTNTDDYREAKSKLEEIENKLKEA